MSDTSIAQGCVVCGPGMAYAEHQVDEAMFRNRETFAYHECAGCGSLQIADIPPNLAEYYSTHEYYSFVESR